MTFEVLLRGKLSSGPEKVNNSLEKGGNISNLGYWETKKLLRLQRLEKFS